jgi:pyruvate dehydrogenase E2 component (dihydrolipoamide acetyltransferase)
MSGEIEIVVPQVGEAVAEVILREWLVAEGATVSRGQPLFLVDTDKAVVEVEAHADGVLAKILAANESAVMPRQVVALLIPLGAADAPPEPPHDRAAGPDVSPVAARLAAELGVDLTTLTGSGPGGRIMVADVEAARQERPLPPSPPAERAGRVAATPKARRLARELGIDLTATSRGHSDGLLRADDLARAGAPAAPPARAPEAGAAEEPAPGEPLSRVRQAIAERMTAAKLQAPHFYLMSEVDMTQAARLRAHLGEPRGGERPPSYTDMIVRAVGLAFRAMPQLNVALAEGRLVRRPTIDVGVAVSLNDGLIVPVLRAVDRQSLWEVSRAQRDAAERARLGRLRPDELGDKSLTVSNLGMRGVDAFVAILDLPAPMILAVGRVAERAVAVDGRVVARLTAAFTLSVDHRVLDGAAAADFLTLIRRHIENPFELLGESQ